MHRDPRVFWGDTIVGFSLRKRKRNNCVRTPPADPQHFPVKHSKKPPCGPRISRVKWNQGQHSTAQHSILESRSRNAPCTRLPPFQNGRRAYPSGSRNCRRRGRLAPVSSSSPPACSACGHSTSAAPAPRSRARRGSRPRFRPPSAARARTPLSPLTLDRTESNVFFRGLARRGGREGRATAQSVAKRGIRHHRRWGRDICRRYETLAGTHTRE